MVPKILRSFLQELFKVANQTSSARKRLLNPSADGAGSRVFPPVGSKLNAKYGIRIDKGEPVTGEEDMIVLNLQVNKEAENSTIKKLARKGTHKIYAQARVPRTQEASEENLFKLLAEFDEDLEARDD